MKIEVGDRVRALEDCRMAEDLGVDDSDRYFYREGDTGSVVRFDGLGAWVKWDNNHIDDGVWYATAEVLALIEEDTSGVDVLAVMEEAEANTYSALSGRIREARAVVVDLANAAVDAAELLESVAPHHPQTASLRAALATLAQQPHAEAQPASYDRKRIAWELERTAMGDGYYGGALRAAKDFPEATPSVRSLLDRWATGKQSGLSDHTDLCAFALQIYAADGEPPSEPVGVEDIIEAFDEITGLCRHLRQGGPAPEDLHDLSGALDEAIGIAGDMLVALTQQPTAVVGVEQVASAIAIEDTGVSWHDVSPRDRTHYVKLARAALAAIAETTGGAA